MPTVTTPDPFAESILYTTSKATFKIIILLFHHFTSHCIHINFLSWKLKPYISWSPAHLSYLSCIILIPITLTSSHHKAVTMAVLSRMFFPFPYPHVYIVYLIITFLQISVQLLSPRAVFPDHPTYVAVLFHILALFFCFIFPHSTKYMRYFNMLSTYVLLDI